MAEAVAHHSQPRDPWAPLVLSLDGGGVRGISSLYILREIMKEVKRIDTAAEVQDRLEENAGDRLPLPCHYFDFIIGTSTGGLIATMLGRLRMGVNECIQKYWVLANAIFQPHRIRFIQLYPRRRVENAVKAVVAEYCDCHDGEITPCTGEEDFRQYDYAEEGDNSNPERVNKSCRVAVLTVREGGRTTFQRKPKDKSILFRSYNHRPRLHLTDGSGREYNPKSLENASLMINEACSCTSAAPTYFRAMLLKGRKFIDGGVQANNPSVIAWNEATQMANPPEGTEPAGYDKKFPNIHISIGTGASKQNSRFGWISIIKFAAQKITETTTAHVNAESLAAEHTNPKYFRFDIPERPYNHKGLAKINLDACKKRRRNSTSLPRPGPQPNTNPHVSSNAAANHDSLQGGQSLQQSAILRLEEARREDVPLQNEVRETRKGGYKPQKYDYKTFDDIRDRTIMYCNSTNDNQDQKARITECAELLHHYSLQRRNLERNPPQDGPRPRSWREFRSHPHPKCTRQE